MFDLFRSACSAATESLGSLLSRTIRWTRQSFRSCRWRQFVFTLRNTPGRVTRSLPRAIRTTLNRLTRTIIWARNNVQQIWTYVLLFTMVIMVGQFFYSHGLSSFSVIVRDISDSENSPLSWLLRAVFGLWIYLYFYSSYGLAELYDAFSNGQSWLLSSFRHYWARMSTTQRILLLTSLGVAAWYFNAGTFVVSFIERIATLAAGASRTVQGWDQSLFSYIARFVMFSYPTLILLLKFQAGRGRQRRAEEELRMVPNRQQVFCSQYSSFSRLNHQVIIVDNRKYELSKTREGRVYMKSEELRQPLDHDHRRAAQYNEELENSEHHTFLIGWTSFTHREISDAGDALVADWDYRLTAHNCIHFARLLANEIVEVEFRAADWGFFQGEDLQMYHLWTRYKYFFNLPWTVVSKVLLSHGGQL